MLLSLFVTIQQIKAQCETVKDGFVNDPSSCAAYFTCSNGIAFPQNCTGIFHFNPDNNMCDYPNPDGTCAGEISCPPDEEFSITGVPDSCTQYLLCFLGKGTVETCAPGLQFDKNTGQCNLVKNVNCIESSACPEVDVPGVPFYVAHPSDCTKYFYCINGRPNEEPISCPTDTKFDVLEGGCVKGVCNSTTIRLS